MIEVVLGFFTKEVTLLVIKIYSSTVLELKALTIPAKYSMNCLVDRLYVEENKI